MRNNHVCDHQFQNQIVLIFIPAQIESSTATQSWAQDRFREGIYINNIEMA